MIRTDENGCTYYENLDEPREEGFIPVKATTILQFFKLSSRKTIIAKDNFIPFKDIPYIVFARSDGRYYRRIYKNYSIEDTFFYYKRYEPEMVEVESLLRYVFDGNVYILYTASDLTEIKDMMTRCYKRLFSGEPPTEKWSAIFYRIIEESLRRENYASLGEIWGYKTVLKTFDDTITELWNQVYLKTQKNESK